MINHRPVLVFLVCVALGIGIFNIVTGARQAGPPAAFTVTWTHDGLLTDGYMVVVDGARSVLQATCTGTGATRACAAPLTLTTGVAHVVTVNAFNVFGEVASDSFAAGPPAKVQRVAISK